MSKKHLEDALQAGHHINAGRQLPQPQTGIRAIDAEASIPGSLEDEGLFALCYADEGRWLVLGTGAEGIRCLDATKNCSTEGDLAGVTTMKQNQPVGGLAIACIRGLRAHPAIVLAASTSGYVYKTDLDSPGFSTVVTERGNHISALDTTDDLLATVGSDCCIRLYDVRSCQPVRMYTSYQGLDPDCPEGHAARLFAVRFNAEGLLLTAGWDGSVKFWDTRLARSDPVGRLRGPHICCPDGLDVKGDRILTGSYRPGSALQLWDTRHCEEPLTSWPVDHIYCAKFTGGGTVTAAGTLSRRVTVWHGTSASETPIGELELDSAAYCMAVTDTAAKKCQLAIGCHSGCLKLASL